MGKVCGICGDTKHVLKGNRWVRCSCVRTQVKHHKYREAGVPQSLWSCALEAIGAESLLVRAGIPVPLLPDRGKLVWLHVNEFTPLRRRTIAHTLRAYVDAGIDAKLLSITELVDSRFDRAMQPLMKRIVVEYPCLILEVSNEIGNKMVPPALKEMFTQRSTMHALTIVVSADDIGEMPARYGAEVAAVMRSRRGITYIGGKSIAHVQFGGGG